MCTSGKQRTSWQGKVEETADSNPKKLRNQHLHQDVGLAGAAVQRQLMGKEQAGLRERKKECSIGRLRQAGSAAWAVHSS